MSPSGGRAGVQLFTLAMQTKISKRLKLNNYSFSFDNIIHSTTIVLSLEHSLIEEPASVCEWLDANMRIAAAYVLSLHYWTIMENDNIFIYLFIYFFLFCPC